MEFALTEEQILLRDSVRRFVAEAHDFSSQQESFRNGSGFPAEHWSMFAELGWLALMVSEEVGGLAGKPEDAGLILEELGRGLVGAPFLSTAVLCGGLIDAATPGEDRTAIIEALMAGQSRIALATEEAASRYEPDAVTTSARIRKDGITVLNGQKIVIPDGADADIFLVTARVGDEGVRAADIAIYLVRSDTPGLEIRRYRTIDGRLAADIDLNNVHLPPGGPLISSDAALNVLNAALDRTRVIMACEALGAMEAALNQTAEYVKARTQFGRPLASFQSLQHRLSDMFVKIENARSMVYRGLAMLDAEPSVRAAAVSATMVAVNQAAEFVGSQAIQLHGGIGMAEEHAIGHYYKRLRVIGKTYGDLNWHMNRYLRLTAPGDRQEAA